MTRSASYYEAESLSLIVDGDALDLWIRVLVVGPVPVVSHLRDGFASRTIVPLSLVQKENDGHGRTGGPRQRNEFCSSFSRWIGRIYHDLLTSTQCLLVSTLQAIEVGLEGVTLDVTEPDLPREGRLTSCLLYTSPSPRD